MENARCRSKAGERDGSIRKPSAWLASIRLAPVPRSYIKLLGAVACTYNLSAEEAERENPKGSLPSQPGLLGELQDREKQSLKTRWLAFQRNDTLKLSSGFYMHVHVCAFMSAYSCMFTWTHTHTTLK